MAKKITRAAKAPAKKATGRTKVLVGRFGQEPNAVTVKKGGSVSDVLKGAKLNVGERERIWLNGTRAALTDKVSTGDIVSVVAPKEAGNL